jgi:hypothetical protein
MSSARPAEAAPAVDPDGRPVTVLRARGGQDAIGDRPPLVEVGLPVRIVQLVLSIVVAIILAGILLVVLKANPANSIVSEVHSWASSLAGPFDGMFSFDNANDAIAVNWGIAAIVYLFIGGLIVRLIGRARR